mmetsp:Transcript_33624/g.62125  ORF Transcript_33624/g.62125 Transcript_33624/m.62125 type:complete len:359 (+) Transcript_33624:428-1504(+)
MGHRSGRVSALAVNFGPVATSLRAENEAPTAEHATAAQGLADGRISIRAVEVCIVVHLYLGLSLVLIINFLKFVGSIVFFLVWNIAFEVKETIQLLAVVPWNAERLAHHIPLSADRISLLGNVFSPVFEAFFHILFCHSSPLVECLESDIRCHGRLVCICEAVISVGAEKHVTHPFIAPPTPAPKWTVARAPLPRHHLTVHGPRHAQVIDDAAADPPEAERSAIEHVRDGRVGRPRTAATESPGDAHVRIVHHDAVGVDAVVRAGGVLLPKVAANLVAREEIEEGGQALGEDVRDAAGCEEAQDDRPDAPEGAAVVLLCVVQELVRVGREAFVDPGGRETVDVVGYDHSAVPEVAECA